MAAPSMRTLRVSLIDLELTPAGPGRTISGEVWVKLTKQVRTTDGQVVVLAAPRRTLDATGIVNFQVPANDDTGIAADDRGFGIKVGWDLTADGKGGAKVNVYNTGTIVLVTTASPAITSFASLAPAVVTDALSVYLTNSAVDAKIVAERVPAAVVVDGKIVANNTTLASVFAPIAAAWRPLTVYKQSQLVTSGGLIYSANADHTSGTPTITLANWTAVGGATTTNASLLTSGTLDDLRLPVASNAASLALKAPLASPAFTGTPTGVTKAHVGLGSVDNTADTAKPVSAAQTAAFVSQVTQHRNIATDGATTASADNAVIIQAAIDAQAAAGGGTVQIPKGIWLTGPLKMKTRVRLTGEGWGSVLKLINGANAHLISLATIQEEQTQIDNLWLDGNAANQSAGAWDVVNLDNTLYNNAVAFPSLGDPNHFMSRVSIVNGKRHGVYVAGDYQQSQFNSVLISDCDENCFKLAGPDCHLINCVSRRSGFDGFYIAGNSSRLVNCKVFLAGRLDATKGSGFYVATVSRVDMTHCEAQDNRQHGYSLNSTAQSAMVACRSDRNGLGPSSAGSGGDGLFCYNVTNSRIDLVSGNRGASGWLQRWAYNCSTGNDGNIVNITAGNGADTTKVGIGSFGVNSVVTITWLGKVLTGAPMVTVVYDGTAWPATRPAAVTVYCLGGTVAPTWLTASDVWDHV